MYIDDAKGMGHEVASNSKANAALTTGIIGTAGVGLGLLGAMGNSDCNSGGILGNLFGGGCNDGSSCHVSRFELSQSERIGSLEAAIASQNSRIYSDSGDLEIYKALAVADTKQTAATNQLFRETFTALAALDKETAVNKMEIDKNFQLVNQKIDCCCSNVGFQISALAQSVNDNYIKADRYISACHVTPYPQAANPQPVPTFVCGGNS